MGQGSKFLVQSRKCASAADFIQKGAYPWRFFSDGLCQSDKDTQRATLNLFPSCMLEAAPKAFCVAGGDPSQGKLHPKP